MNNTNIALSEITDSSYEINQESLVTGVSINSLSYTNSTGPTEVTSAIVNQASSSVQSDISDTYLDTIYITNVVSNNNYSQGIDMPCSINGTTAITYSLIQNGVDTVPSFVSYDNTTFTLTILHPEVTSDTNFTFKIYANTSSETYEREVYISVLACLVEN